MGEEVEQSPQHMRSRGTRKLSDVREASEEEEADATAVEATAPVKVTLASLQRSPLALPDASREEAKACEADMPASKPRARVGDDRQRLHRQQLAPQQQARATVG